MQQDHYDFSEPFNISCLWHVTYLTYFWLFMCQCPIPLISSGFFLHHQPCFLAPFRWSKPPTSGLLLSYSHSPQKSPKVTWKQSRRANAIFAVGSLKTTCLSMACLPTEVVHALAGGRYCGILPRHTLAILCVTLPVLSRLLFFLEEKCWRHGWNSHNCNLSGCLWSYLRRESQLQPNTPKSKDHLS